MCRRLLLLKHKKDKTHKKTIEKNQEKGGNLSSNSCFALSLLVPAFALMFQALYPSYHFCPLTLGS